MDARDTPGVTYRPDNKYDMQLSDAKIDEKRLGDIFEHGIIEKIELKSESYQWEKEGNIFIEYECNGKPSGLKATEATCWVHELKRDGETLVYLMFPTQRLKKLANEAFKAGGNRTNSGDHGKIKGVVIPLKEILS